MFRFLGLAALIGAAWALFRRKPRRHGSGGGPPQPEQRTRTAIVIGGSATAPVITLLPQRLSARRGAELTWDVTNRTGASQEISLEKFTRVSGPPPAHAPLTKSDAERRVRTDSAAIITDRVRGNASGGTYKYSIWLNGSEAVDPEIVIQEEG